MASLERRQRPRRQRRVGRYAEGLGGDALEIMDSVKSLDCVERLAHKYMRKCVVESSTESESESSVEVLHNPVAEGLRKARDSKGLQFLDPYDGDSEDTATHSDCSLSSLNSIEVAPWMSSAPKAMAFEDADPSGNGESFPQPLDCSQTKISDVHSQRVNDGKSPLELPSQQKDFPRSLLQSSKLRRDTEVLPSMWLMPDPSLLVGVNPSAPAHLLASAGDNSPQPLLADDCDGTNSRQPLIKRKGITISESAGEKRRKKIRAI
ncbi:uncharacterized protein LOC128087352 isoform X1 [Tympanuchus pallidicinctus]|uniref:uncharacterized protein LOC128087352 isoform X1 n=1 Tax=Tympanuchus pallidicinctus TaxID=109042 RepID=UPI002287632E|nr:uncharacterized protein LOC128087352 isoform X1 [Tympanuchus pallidicinctus]XP_052552774.1 uncharacterized protein LOC128087352 isoform X1 [Tympanuchus pallidicinctus]